MQTAPLPPNHGTEEGKLENVTIAEEEPNVYISFDLASLGHRSDSRGDQRHVKDLITNVAHLVQRELQLYKRGKQNREAKERMRALAVKEKQEANGSGAEAVDAATSADISTSAATAVDSTTDADTDASMGVEDEIEDFADPTIVNDARIRVYPSMIMDDTGTMGHSEKEVPMYERLSDVVLGSEQWKRMSMPVTAIEGENDEAIVVEEPPGWILWSKSKCWNCGRPDHAVRHCPYKRDHQRSAENREAFMELTQSSRRSSNAFDSSRYFPSPTKRSIREDRRDEERRKRSESRGPFDPRYSRGIFNPPAPPEMASPAAHITLRTIDDTVDTHSADGAPPEAIAKENGASSSSESAPKLSETQADKVRSLYGDINFPESVLGYTPLPSQEWSDKFRSLVSRMKTWKGDQQRDGLNSHADDFVALPPAPEERDEWEDMLDEINRAKSRKRSRSRYSPMRSRSPRGRRQSRSPMRRRSRRSFRRSWSRSPDRHYSRRRSRSPSPDRHYRWRSRSRDRSSMRRYEHLRSCSSPRYDHDRHMSHYDSRRHEDCGEYRNPYKRRRIDDRQ